MTRTCRRRTCTRPIPPLSYDRGHRTCQRCRTTSSRRGYDPYATRTRPLKHWTTWANTPRDTT